MARHLVIITTTFECQHLCIPDATIAKILLVGIEPTTLGLLDPRANQLSHKSGSFLAPKRQTLHFESKSILGH